jgi:hypothetical protein
MLANLGLALQARFERGGQLADLDAAIRASQGAVDATPPDSEDEREPRTGQPGPPPD